MGFIPFLGMVAHITDRCNQWNKGLTASIAERLIPPQQIKTVCNLIVNVY